MEADFFIVGQGLAGTLLANELLRRKQTILVFDDPDLPKASAVAAGLINPVVFRRMTKSWLIDETFPQMETTYRQLEDLLQASLYFPAKILKTLNEQELIFWKEKAFANKLTNYITAEPLQFHRNKYLENASSFGLVNSSGRLDIHKFVSSFSIFLEKQNMHRHERFDTEKLLVHDNFVSYEGLRARKIIFCEGSAASQNPFFQKLKFKHSKGELLELEIPDLNLDEIISDDIFMMPVGNNRYKAGATYSWDELNAETTATAREELLQKLKNMIDVPFKVIDQKAGIRPTMHDRKPVIGLSPDQPNIGIFNGLGSKGVLLGPYFARQLAEFLTGNSTYIHPEAHIGRYFRH